MNAWEDDAVRAAALKMEAAGAQMTSWIQVLLELQRDWTRHETYDGSRAIVETNGGGYGIDLLMRTTCFIRPERPDVVASFFHRNPRLDSWRQQ